ncbi:MAG: GxxExxY protein [bacterium]|nr:GxxExxY protein [bacterium]
MAKEKSKVAYPELSYQIVGCLFKVFNNIGPNHRESYYQKAVATEFSKAGVKFIQQYSIDLKYKGEKIGNNFLDFYVEDKVILELKTGRFVQKSDFQQLHDYLRTSGLELGIIACFTAKGVNYHRILNISRDNL